MFGCPEEIIASLVIFADIQKKTIITIWMDIDCKHDMLNIFILFYSIYIYIFLGGGALKC